jgi:NitT/TauT family transport system permease protein
MMEKKERVASRLAIEAMSQTPSENQPNAARESRTTQLQSAQPPVEQSTDLHRRNRFFNLRQPLRPLTALALGILCILLCAGIWWLVTRGEIAEERLISKAVLPSPRETFATFPSLWYERAFTRNLFVTLRRLVLGFGLAALVGVPLGVLAGCFPPVQAFLTPLILFGRNIPIAALIPLTFIFFGIAETQKVMFIFLACVAFIIADSASNIMAVGQQYIDTAYTLGAKRRHIITKVLVPLALPAIFDSLRLLFGLAFGYIMLAETVKLGGEEGGLGNLILMSQRRTLTGHIILIILMIPIVALAIDRGLFFVQKQLFPYRYGGMGILKHMVGWFVRAWQELKGMILRPDPKFERMVADQLAAIAAKNPDTLRRLKDTSARKSQTEWRP